MKTKQNWEETRERFAAWWRGQKTDRPLINVWVKRETPLKNPHNPLPFSGTKDKYLNTKNIIAHTFHRLCAYEPLGEAFPSISLNLGAGSMALYLGCQAQFSGDSLWFHEKDVDYSDPSFALFDPSNHWYRTHLDMYRQAKEAVLGTDILLCIPDLVESLDILASIRSNMKLCVDFYDNPDQVKEACGQIDGYYKTIFDAFNEYCIDEHGGNAYTAFEIWGMGRTAKVQCDLAALLSPETFLEFEVPHLDEQCKWLDNSIFHLDGPECICHVPALMGIKELNALQWTPGYTNPHGGEECWDDLYTKVKGANKGLWVSLGDYTPDVAVAKAERLVRKFGAGGFYFLFPDMTKKDAETLLIKAEKEWKN